MAKGKHRGKKGGGSRSGRGHQTPVLNIQEVDRNSTEPSQQQPDPPCSSRGRGRGDLCDQSHVPDSQDVDRNTTDPSQPQPDPPCSSRGRGRGDLSDHLQVPESQDVDRNTTDPTQPQPDPHCDEEDDSTPFWTRLMESSRGLVKRPDKVGENFAKTVKLLANHFRIRFNEPSATLIHYKVGVTAVTSEEKDGKTVYFEENPSVKNNHVQELYSNFSEHFPADRCSYDGGEYIFSAHKHDTTEFKVKISETCDHIFSVEEGKPLQLSLLRLYFSGEISDEVRHILFSGLNSLMKESSKRSMIRFRRNFYKREPLSGFIGRGAAVHTGFKQRLKLTSQGPALCLDYSAVPFYRRSIMSFLKETVTDFKEEEHLKTFRKEVEEALDGLKVQATHKNKMKYSFVGLTSLDTKDLRFTIEKQKDPDFSIDSPTTVVEYFQKKHGLNIVHKDIPCLILRRKNSDIYMPIQFCELAERQMCPKLLNLERYKKKSVVSLEQRKKEISEIVSDPHGPFGNGVFSKNFGIQLTPHMTVVDGGVIDPPPLKLTKAGGRPSNKTGRTKSEVTVNKGRCDWKYSGNYFVEGIKVKQWALVNLAPDVVNNTNFIKDLRERSSKLGMDMEPPAELSCSTDDISCLDKIQNLVQNAIGTSGSIQIIIFIMTDTHKSYYGYLKWALETKFGVISQCCLTEAYSSDKKRVTFLDNLCMKINGKIGGSNVELGEPLPVFTDRDLVMFIGADVNHPAAKDNTSLSIAAVVGTVNWPAANRYVARIETQECRKERILNFGAMCKDLVNTFSKSNKGKKPDKIVVFRDGVGEGQFDTVLQGELGDLKQAIFTVDYKPKITLVLAQKRHHTRIFQKDEAGNVVPGTVVESVIVHPRDFDFYLCSHYGATGTSKPVHYYVLLDENEFPSHDLQKLIYHLCFTYARCTKPVSLVPPVYYADRVATRGRMYYEAALKEKNSNAAASSSSANPSVEGCCKLHSYVENTMFFI